MPFPATDLLRQVEAELAVASDQLASARELILDQVAEIRDLARERTDAFVELARHYLPELTHQGISNAWSEVRGEIEELLLRKNDQQRRLRKQLSELDSEHQTLRTTLEELAREAEHARLSLSSKMGNYRKRLREDPEILRCNEAIKSVDRQVERALAQLEFAEEEARTKLPDYEESALFDYLRDRHFGTPAYTARGIERRWDRWVARLIDFKDAKKSYDLLSETPDLLKELINEKQARYLELLEQLETARDKAKTQFGIQEQTRTWQQACARVEQIEKELEQVQRKATELRDRIHQINDVDGEFYRQAIEVYRALLAELEPNVLKVYASCTDSPIDDEICARLRSIEKEIEDAQQRSAEQKQKIFSREDYVAALRDLASRLRSFLQRSPGTTQVHHDLDLPALLRRLLGRDLGVNEVWSKLRESMVRPRAAIPMVPGRPDPVQTATTVSPLKACYIAAREPAADIPSDDRTFDASGIVLVDFSNAQTPGADHAGFATLAVCGSRDEAQYLVSHLDSQSIAGFVRTRYGDTVYAGREFESDEYHVVVDARKHARAAGVLRELQQKFSSFWECPRCRNRVDNRRARCWSCGRQRDP